MALGLAGAVGTAPLLAACTSTGEPTAEQSAPATPAVGVTPSTDTPLILLGTYPGPMLSPDRPGIASLVTVADAHYLIDAGVGVATQLSRVGLMPSDVSAVLLTHLHDDHTAGLPAWATFRYTTQIGADASPPLRLIGPPGTEALATATAAYLEVSGAIRRGEDGASGPATAQTVVGEVVMPGVVLEAPGIRVLAVENTHYSDHGALDPGGSLSYSYRVELADRTIVFTGDTGPSDAVTELARGADVLVAEMVSDDTDVDAVPGYSSLEEVQAGHLSPGQIGQMAPDAAVGRVVLSHYPMATDADLAKIRAVYDGEVTAGISLMQL